jgi:predicted RNA-binding Zn-ribbon protein involved in translation (DUF1610 family)
MPELKWRIVEEGAPQGGWTGSVLFTCPRCGVDALLPVQGIAIAQVDGALIFDPGPQQIPKIVECRRCRRQFERAA